MNPQNGLKILPYKDAPNNHTTDNELFFLSRYLRLIANYDDLTTLDHSLWKEYLAEHGHKLASSE